MERGLYTLDGPALKGLVGRGLPGVPDVSKADSSESEYESWGDSDDDDDQQSDDERTKSDDDKSADLNKTDVEEENEFLNNVHDTFHVSNFKKCLADPALQIPLEEIQVDAKFNFVEELIEILEREFKKLKRSRIAIVKVR
ncbi:hypothetical protein Tco_1237220 [Tanacetum coccineum]